MIKTYKVKLNLNNKQKTKLHNNVSVARFTFNLTLEMQQKNYEQGNKFLQDGEIRKLITIRKQEELSWLYKYDCDIVKQAVKDACIAYKKFFKKQSKFPRFKSKRRNKQSFYVDVFKLKVGFNYIKIPLVGNLRLHESDYIPINVKYYNPRITFDGIDWFISGGVEEEYNPPKLTKEVIGIDLGLKNLAFCSNGTIIANISKSKSYKKISKSKRRLQRQVSRKYKLNKQGSKFIKTKNIIKLERKIKVKQIKLNNIKLDFFHKQTTTLVRTKPRVVVVEDLNVNGMMKNKHLSKSFQESSLNTFKVMLLNKCKRDNIEVVEADRFFPSSKLCSSCGSTKHDLKLKDRIYKCSSCGLEIDRDYSASLNLKRYPEFQGNLSLWRVTSNDSSARNSMKSDSMKQEFYKKFDCQVSIS